MEPVLLQAIIYSYMYPCYPLRLSAAGRKIHRRLSGIPAGGHEVLSDQCLQWPTWHTAAGATPHIQHLLYPGGDSSAVSEGLGTVL